MRARGLSLVLTAAAPLAVIAVPVVLGLPVTELLVELLLGVVLVAVLSRRIEAAVLLMLVYLPFQQVLLAGLLTLGLPVPAIRALGYVKELVVVALVVTAVRHRVDRRFDWLDRLGLGLIGLTSLYLVAPVFLPGVFADVPLNVRFVAWRTDLLFVIGLLVARRVRWSLGFLRRAALAVTGVAVVASAGALVESLSPKTWSDFLINGIHIRIFRALLANDHRRPTDELVHATLGGSDVIRAGSISLTPLVLGFLLLPGLAFALERLLSGRRTAVNAASVVLIGAGVVATLTRSAILGALVVLLLTFRSAVLRRRPGRVQLGVGVALVALLLGPFIATSAVVERTSSAFSGDASAQAHQTASLSALNVVLSQPLGRGLGTSALGERFAVAQQVTSENAYLQVGAEVGVVAMVLFVALVLALLVALARRARLTDEAGVGASALLAAGAGLALGGMFLHVWLDLATSMTFWTLAGVALATGAPGAEGQAAGPAERPALTSAGAR